MSKRFEATSLVGMFMLALAGGAQAADLQRLPASGPAGAPSARMPAPAAKPDLAIVTLAWSSPPKAGQRIGYSSILNVQVRNLGAAGAPATQIRYSCQRVAPAGGCPAVLSGVRALPALGPGASVGVAWPDAATELWTAGSYRIEVLLDSRNQLAEGSETNNRRGVTFTVAGTAAAPPMTAPSATGMTSPLEKRAINPQPEPPGKVNRGMTSPATNSGINPQPEPPGMPIHKVMPPAEMKGINPQPEPPGKGVTLQPQSRLAPQLPSKPATSKVVTVAELTLTGRTPAPFVAKVATAEQLTVTGRTPAPFTPKIATAEQLTVTGRAATPFVPKVVTSAVLTVTGRR